MCLNRFVPYALLLVASYSSALFSSHQTLRTIYDVTGESLEVPYIYRGATRSILKKIRHFAHYQKWKDLAHSLSKINGDRGLSEVLAIAEEEDCYPLQQVTLCLKRICPSKESIGISKDQLIDTAFFMETKFPSFFRKNKVFYKSKKTGLPYNIKYDKDLNRRFIDLKKVIGQGSNKIVKTSILYHGANSEVVTQGVQSSRKRKEMSILKKLMDSPGIVETKGFVKSGHKITIFYKYYNQGSLRRFLEKYTKLTLCQKSGIALDILTGLNSIHKHGIAHLDLAPSNCLVNLKKCSKTGKVEITAAIADFGCARKINHCVHTRVQGNSAYTAPEGIFLHRMRHRDYFYSDIYAVGLGFYKLFYGVQPPWMHKKFVKNLKKEEHKRYKELTKAANYYTRKRRVFLNIKSRVVGLTPSEQFEKLVLHMVHVSPDKRGSASSLRREMVEIHRRICEHHEE